MSDSICGFIGLGLIGGSIAKAIRKFMPDYKIIAYDLDQDSLDQALQTNIIDQVCTQVGADLSNCDLIFLCTPVSHNNHLLKELAPYVKEGAIVTDVGSVKSSIHQTVQNSSLSKHFIGGHPMAGSETSGFAHSNPLLLENAFYVFTPTPDVSQDQILFFQSFIQNLRAIPIQMTYEEHDYITAAISHLPHVIASSLVNLVNDCDDDNGKMKLIAAGGFKDITRIASSNPTMWQQICLNNSENIVSLLESYIMALETIKEHVEQKDSSNLYSFFERSKNYRDSFADASSGPLKKSFAIYLDIPDEAGAIATTATLLAKKAISIKNIGIMHNREYEEGALRIEFYDEQSSLEAIQTLKDHTYTIYERK